MEPDINKLLRDRGIELKYIERPTYRANNLPEMEIITNDDSFTKKLLSDAGFNSFYAVRYATVETADQIAGEIGKTEREILGVGGGKAIDVAKRVSMKLERPYISFPTAPSHDGIFSVNYSLSDGYKRNSAKAKYPIEIIIPLYLWENSGSLKKAGICDLLSNIVALQDVSLAEEDGFFYPNPLYRELSNAAVDKVRYMENDRDLADALILSGIAMEEGSQYCSGSDHEVERLLERKMNGRYLHGQLAGTGTLIAAKAYTFYADKLPKTLEFPSDKIFGMVTDAMRKRGILGFALQPLRDPDFDPNWLKEVSAERPERHTLWNVVDSKGVDWGIIIESILKSQ